MKQSCKKIVLVIDDRQDTNQLVRTVLELEGLHTESAHCAIAAITKLHSITPNLILSDIFLPDINGYELTQYLRQSGLCKSCPILLYSAHAKNLVNDGQQYGSNGMIRDIVDFDNLINQIELALALPANRLPSKQMDQIYKSEEKPVSQFIRFQRQNPQESR
ncbi:response regulator [Leptolyngbya sp. AN03gr2]|uniref:response regulator n=1 Tax=unclassified Leptolyngbya TaxID=2650499 RepID=UPI003D323BD6